MFESLEACLVLDDKNEAADLFVAAILSCVSVGHIELWLSVA